jgi:hypothetical protein
VVMHLRNYDISSKHVQDPLLFVLTPTYIYAHIMARRS